MPSKRDYYEVLGLTRNATAEDIRKAYRRLARQYHPDINQSPDAAEKFAEIGEAHSVLSDPEKRKAYDQFGHAGVGAAAQGGFDPRAWSAAGARQRGGPGPGAGSGGAEFNVEDIGSIFEEMFGSQAGRSPFGGASTRTHTARPRKGADIQHAVDVTFLTAAFGGQERLRITAPDGSVQTIDVRIPAGIESGAKLRLKGKGQPGVQGGAAGDLLLTINLGSHPYFRREGLDVLLDLPITIAEAALGATVTVPLLKGTADVRIPPGASSGRRLRLKGKGITDAKGKSGDFHVVIQIIGPENLSDRAKELLESLGPELKNPRDSAPWADQIRRTESH